MTIEEIVECNPYLYFGIGLCIATIINTILYLSVKNKDKLNIVIFFGSILTSLTSLMLWPCLLVIGAVVVVCSIPVILSQLLGKTILIIKSWLKDRKSAKFVK
jgi:hypothetical protein